MQHPVPFAINYQHHDNRCYRNLSGRLVVILLAGLMLASVNVQAGYPRDEIAFCPSGGPTGWMNFFDKRDREKRWKKYWRYRQYQQAPRFAESHSMYRYPASYQPTWPATTYYAPPTSGGQGFGYR